MDWVSSLGGLLQARRCMRLVEAGTITVNALP